MLLRKVEEVPLHDLTACGLLHRPLKLPSATTQLMTLEHAAQLVTEEAEANKHTKNPDRQEKALVEVLTSPDEQRERNSRQAGNKG